MGIWSHTLRLYGSDMTMTAADVVEILGWLAEADAEVWLDGGWGVDALLGEQTREHDDLDLIVRDVHESRMREVLRTHGFTQIPGGVPQSFILADEAAREVDVHPVRFDDDGIGHVLSERGEPFVLAAEAFAATGSVSGHPVACLSAEAQMSNHSWGYTPGDSDFHDMRLLHDRLGTPLVGPYRST
jgi:lincosamide nucleotidyltransferase A/C/D/E